MFTYQEIYQLLKLSFLFFIKSASSFELKQDLEGIQLHKLQYKILSLLIKSPYLTKMHNRLLNWIWYDKISLEDLT